MEKFKTIQFSKFNADRTRCLEELAEVHELLNGTRIENYDRVSNADTYRREGLATIAEKLVLIK